MKKCCLTVVANKEYYIMADKVTDLTFKISSKYNFDINKMLSVF